MIPLTFVVGPAGSGKTRLIDALLREPGMADTLVVFGEFGATTCAHPLQTHASMAPAGRLRPLCDCCRVPRDLPTVLAEATWRFARGGQRAFSRVIVESGEPIERATVHERLAGRAQRGERWRDAGLVAVLPASIGSALAAGSPWAATVSQARWIRAGLGEDPRADRALAAHAARAAVQPEATTTRKADRYAPATVLLPPLAADAAKLLGRALVSPAGRPGQRRAHPA